MFEGEVNKKNRYLRNSLSRYLISWYFQEEFDRQTEVERRQKEEARRRRPEKRRPRIRQEEHDSMTSDEEEV